MKDKTLPYFLTISPTICHIKIFILTFLPLKHFILFPYETNKLLWYQLWPFRQSCLTTMFFLKLYSMVVKLPKMLINPALPNHVTKII